MRIVRIYDVHTTERATSYRDWDLTRDEMPREDVLRACPLVTWNR